MSLYVRILTASTSLDEDCLADAISIGRRRPVGLLTALSDEDVDASTLETAVDRNCQLIAAVIQQSILC